MQQVNPSPPTPLIPSSQLGLRSVTAEGDMGTPQAEGAGPGGVDLGLPGGICA